MRQTFALLAIVALAATLNAQTAPPGGAKPASPCCIKRCSTSPGRWRTIRKHRAWRSSWLHPDRPLVRRALFRPDDSAPHGRSTGGHAV